MVSPAQSPVHPGTHIKRSVLLPAGMSVTKAADLLGVGRPALSNLLNGNAALSSEMALRLEKAFGAKSETLLQMQAAYDEFQTRQSEKVVAVRAYAPSFMDISAGQIDAWADRTSSRSQLPAFLRRLVLTTGENLTKVDFPAFDNAQRPGWTARSKPTRRLPDTVRHFGLGVWLQQEPEAKGRGRLRGARGQHRGCRAEEYYICVCHTPQLARKGGVGASKEGRRNLEGCQGTRRKRSRTMD